jgi:hypothetical protein
MTRARANSWRTANRLVAATPGASLPLDASVLSIVANLEGLDLNGLRRQWRAHLGGEAPAHLSRWLLMKVLAHRLQSDAFGALDKSIRRILRSGKEYGVGAPFDRRVPQTREGLGLKAGALLVREWNGKLERVMILDEGFAWNGQTFGSLSQIAKAMTGTTWNGHRFFGLRQGKTPAADAGADRRKARNRTAVLERMARRRETRRHEGSDDQAQLATLTGFGFRSASMAVAARPGADCSAAGMSISSYRTRSMSAGSPIRARCTKANTRRS